MSKKPPVTNTDDENQDVNPSQLHQSRLGLVSQSLMMLITTGFLFAETLEEFWKTKLVQSFVSKCLFVTQH